LRRAGGGGGDSDPDDDDSSTSRDTADDPSRSDDSTCVGNSPSPSRSPVRTRSVATKSRSNFVRPDKYDGTSSFETFIVKFENCADFNEWSTKEKLAHLWSSLQKEAAQLLWGAHGLTYEELVNRLRQRFGSKDMEERFQTELRCRRRKRGESVRELAQDIRRLLTLAYPGEQSRLVEHLGRDAFLAALDYPDLELRIRECEPQSLDAAVHLAQRFEIYRDVVGTPPGRSRQHATRQVTGDITPDKKVDVLSLPELQVVVKEAVRCAVADCNGKKNDNVSTSGCEKVAQKLSSPDGVCKSRLR